MLKTAILIDKTKKLNLKKLDTEIAASMGWKRHTTETDKDCYSGLATHQELIGGELRTIIEVVWTLDGINGFIKKDISVADMNKLKVEIGKHNG